MDTAETDKETSPHPEKTNAVAANTFSHTYSNSSQSEIGISLNRSLTVSQKSIMTIPLLG